MTIDELLAREEIRVLIASYNMAGDRGRLNELADAFADDGVLTRRLGNERFSTSGNAAIAEMLAKPRRASGVDSSVKVVIRHNITTSLVTFDGPDQARARTYYFAVTEIGPDHAGLYVDEFKKVDGAWKIASREVRLDWAAPNGHAQQTLNALAAAG
jgi:hypothetical protein